MAIINRTKNASRNIIYGVFFRVFTLCVPFVMRTAMIYLMGVEYLGLSSLFLSVLQVLNMAELGVSSAMVYSMYRPIAEDDTETICALMKLYRRYYRLIGLLIAVAGTLLTPFIPKLISGEVPDGINIYILYYLYLTSTVLSYWLFAYKNSLLLAYQRTDISSKIALLTGTVQYVIQFLVLLVFRNYYYYVAVLVVTQAITNVATALSVDKMFPMYKPRGSLEKEYVKDLNQRIKDLFATKIGTVLGNSVNAIVISANLGLTILAIYQNYYQIMIAVTSFVEIILASVRAGIGNSLIVEDSEKNYNDFKKLQFIIMWVITICVSCFVALYQPFMKLWVGENLLLPFPTVILFCLYFFMLAIQHLAWAYKDASGIWHEDRFRPIIVGAVNFVLNILLVRKYGLLGILLATVFSYGFISIPWVFLNVFKYVLKRSAKTYFLQTARDFLIIVGIGAICYIVCERVTTTGIWELAIRLVIAVVISNGVLMLVHRKNVLFSQMVNLIKRIVFRK